MSILPPSRGEALEKSNKIIELLQQLNALNNGFNWISNAENYLNSFTRLLFCRLIYWKMLNPIDKMYDFKQQQNVYSSINQILLIMNYSKDLKVQMDLFC